MASEKGKKMDLLLNHIALVCKSVEKSVKFYEELLGFEQIKRPNLDVRGAWLHKYGVSIHLLDASECSEEDLPKRPDDQRPDPKGNHTSFECKNFVSVKEKLKEKLEKMKYQYTESEIKEGDNIARQLFFYDPNGYMIEICECQNIPVEPLLPAMSTATGNERSYERSLLSTSMISMAGASTEAKINRCTVKVRIGGKHSFFCDLEL